MGRRRRLGPVRRRVVLVCLLVAAALGGRGRARVGAREPRADRSGERRRARPSTRRGAGRLRRGRPRRAGRRGRAERRRQHRCAAARGSPAGTRSSCRCGRGLVGRRLLRALVDRLRRRPSRVGRDRVRGRGGPRAAAGGTRARRDRARPSTARSPAGSSPPARSGRSGSRSSACSCSGVPTARRPSGSRSSSPCRPCSSRAARAARRTASGWTRVTGRRSPQGFVVAVVVALLAGAATLERRALRPALVLALGLVAVPSVAGHALDPGLARVNLAADVLHVAGAAAWAGVLVGVVALPLAPAELRRASSLALVAVAVVAVTGIVRASFELLAVSQLWSTGYGRALLVKTALFVPLVGLGWLNRARLVPLLARARLRRNVTAELVLLVALVAAVAVLVQLRPGRNDRRPRRRAGARRAHGRADPTAAAAAARRRRPRAGGRAARRRRRGGAAPADGHRALVRGRRSERSRRPLPADRRDGRAVRQRLLLRSARGARDGHRRDPRPRPGAARDVRAPGLGSRRRRARPPGGAHLPRPRRRLVSRAARVRRDPRRRLPLADRAAEPRLLRHPRRRRGDRRRRAPLGPGHADRALARLGADAAHAARHAVGEPPRTRTSSPAAGAPSRSRSPTRASPRSSRSSSTGGRCCRASCT